jgi:hypothetical protein
MQRATLGFEWTADRAKAQTFSADRALAAARLFIREYGTMCHVVDADGCGIKPRAADTAEPQGIARKSEFRRIRTADVTAHSPHCAEHAGFTDGCADCYDMHLERAS